MNFESAKTWEGQVVDGKFPLQQWLGGSGRSAVFLTEMNSTKAAIKLIAADTLDANMQLLRWQQAAQLSHPHLIRVLTEGRCDTGGAGLLYVVMDYAEENLSEILCQRALTAEETQDVLQSVLHALGYLHGQGFVHGHIRPSNILAQGSQIMLPVDRIGTSDESSDNARLGSVYDAPELPAAPLSPAVDMWSLGVALVEALTQRPVALESSIYKEVHVPEKVPEPFRSIARDCLRRDPGQRCTVAEIEARLKSAPTVTDQAPTLETRQPLVRILIPVAAILLLAAIFAGPKLLSHHKELAAENTAQTQQPVAAARPAATSPESTPANRESTKNASKGEVSRQVLPAVPQRARNTIRGRVKVAVLVDVDQSGRVTSATLSSPGPSRYFAKLALNAAQQWQFTAPQVGGQPVPSAWLLRFQFGRTGTQVFPAQK